MPNFTVTTRLRRKFLTGLCAVIGAQDTALAQHAELPIVLGANLVGIRARNDSAGTATAFGAGVLAGVAVHPAAVVFMRIDIAAAPARLVGHADVGARVSPLRSGRLLPYGEIAFTSRGDELPGDRMLLGTGLSVAAGAEWLIRPNRSIDAAVVWWRGGHDELRRESRPVASDLATRGRTLRIQLGYRIRPALR